jgi:DNA-binding NarL/FixJ family response regulator
MPSAKRGNAKPRLLLADDNTRVVQMVRGLLSADFDIVAEAPDGRQALDLSLDLDPDVIVLDVSMPELDGFQTVRKLRAIGSRAKVVLLTLHREDSFVIEGIRSGANGYVPKERIFSDLVSAINHALAGRIFVPSLTALAAVVEKGHVAHFHKNDNGFLHEMTEFISSTLQSGESIVLVATEETRTGIAGRLKARGVDISAMSSLKQYVEMGATECLVKLMRDGRPDHDRLAENIADLDQLRLSFSRNPKSRPTIVGEMAVPLCRSGNSEAAVELEKVWTLLSRSIPFLTICSYPLECFQDEVRSRLFPSVCHEHRAITHTTTPSQR